VSLHSLSPKIYRRGELACEEATNNPSCFTVDKAAGIKQPCTIASAIALLLFVRSFSYSGFLLPTLLILFLI